MNPILRLLRRLFPEPLRPVPVRVSCIATLLAATLALGAGPMPSMAQVRGEGAVSLIFGVPQNGFSTQVDGAGIGIGLFAGASSRRSPILVGVDLGFLIYGYERRSEPFSYTIPDVYVDVVTSNNIFLGHFLVRLRPPTGPVRPYAEGLFGMKYLFTTTEIRNEWYYDDEPIAVSTNFDDAAPSYGVGGGIDLQISRGGGRGRPAVMLHAGVRYLFGGQADYLREGSIRRESGRVGYDVARSETDLLINEFGISMRF